MCNLPMQVNIFVTKKVSKNWLLLRLKRDELLTVLMSSNEKPYAQAGIMIRQATSYIILKTKPLQNYQQSQLQRQVFLYANQIGIVSILINHCLLLSIIFNINYSFYLCLFRLKANFWAYPTFAIVHRSNKRTYACIMINHSHLRSLYSSTLSCRKNILTISNTINIRKHFMHHTSKAVEAAAKTLAKGKDSLAENAIKSATSVASSHTSPSNSNFGTSTSSENPPLPKAKSESDVSSSSKKLIPNAAWEGFKNLAKASVKNADLKLKHKSDNNLVPQENYNKIGFFDTSTWYKRYKVVYASADYRKADEEGTPQSSYDGNHLLLYDSVEKRVIGLLTSTNKGPDTILINLGKNLDGSDGDQYFRFFGNFRMFTFNEEHQTTGFTENLVATQLLHRNCDMNSILKEYAKFYNNGSRVRVHKDDTYFYNEDGTRNVSPSMEPVPQQWLSMKKLLEYLNNFENEDKK
jgi:hypothetical protein